MSMMLNKCVFSKVILLWPLAFAVGNHLLQLTSLALATLLPKVHLLVREMIKQRIKIMKVNLWHRKSTFLHNTYRSLFCLPIHCFKLYYYQSTLFVYCFNDLFLG